MVTGPANEPTLLPECVHPELVDAVRGTDPVAAARAYQTLYAFGEFPLPHPLCGPECDLARDPVPASKLCSSPGKVPHVKAWQKRPGTIITGEEFRRLFRPWGHMRDNVGAAHLIDTLALDVDVKSGGSDSLKVLEFDVGAIPTTPTERTGGGGLQYFLRLPPGVGLETPLKAGVALDLGSYPGIEYKAHGGQSVLPPSIHASGRRYMWLPGLSPAEVRIADIPDGLLALILRAQTAALRRNGTRERSGSNAPQGSLGPTPLRAIVAAFRDTYPQGARRSSQGLPRLVGLLRARGVTDEEAVRFLQDWQRGHFAPPLADEEIEHHVRAMYVRYGLVPARPGWRPFLDVLDDALGRRADEELGDATFPHSPDEGDDGPLARSPVSDDQELEPGSLAASRITEVYGLKGRAHEVERAGIFTFSEVRMKGENPCILFDPPGMAPSKEALVTMLYRAMGKESDNLQALRECGWDQVPVCADGHENWTRASHRTCKLPFHSACPTRETWVVGRLNLPDLQGEARYRAVWLNGFFQRDESEDGSLIQDWEDAYRTRLRGWDVAVAHEARRKKTGDLILARSISARLGSKVFIPTFKIIIREDYPGQADPIIQRLTEALGATIQAESETQSGDMVVKQMMADSMNHLVGVEDTTGWEFAAFYKATKGRHLFQTFGALQKLGQTAKDAMKEEKPEPILCEFCGKPCKWKAFPPANGKEGESANRRRWREGQGPPK